MPKGNVDQFANIAAFYVTETAANTLTFKKLETGISLNEKVAWVISQVELFPANWNVTQFADAGDYADIALTVSNTITDIGNLMDPQVLMMMRIMKFEEGTPANAWFEEMPIVRDFSNLAGGGLIVPPVPLYLGAKGSGLAAAGTYTVRFYYTMLELSTDQYWQLVEARRIISS